MTPGIKEIKGIALKMGTVGNYSLCYHGVINGQVCESKMKSENCTSVGAYSGSANSLNFIYDYL